MILAVTNSADATADYLLAKLGEAGIPFIRLDTDTLLGRVKFSYSLGRPSLQVDGEQYRPGEIDHVWYRRPEKLSTDTIPDTPEGRCILDEWSESLEAFFAHIPRSCWMNVPAANALASRKLEQLTTAHNLGFQIPDTLVTQDPSALRGFFDSHGGNIIVKPLGRAYIERPGDAIDSLIYTNRVMEADLASLEDLTLCPTLFQRAVHKMNDIRITVVDNDIHAVELVAKDVGNLQRCDIRRNNMADVSYKTTELPEDVAKKIRALVSHYNLRFAAIDMAVETNGTWQFFEINPNGQWAWLDLCAGTKIYASFVSAFETRLINGDD